ncbi:molybdopterin-dependent oxidoreductase [Bradyrhizobium oligotrophicum]|uniref:molybdopterin-dependent oxidoreductase n=2 Tax=Bradyrhizobium oligotrophicum TaxID=44255 RepID=UPI003EC01455
MTALSRRSFLTSVAGVGAAALLGRPAFAAPTGPGEFLCTSTFGAAWATVKDGRVVSLRPWEKDPHPSPLLDGVLDSLYSPTRIRYPMVRRAYLEKGPGAAPETRGTDDFVRVPWEKALDLVAAEIKRCQDQYGPWSIYTGTYGWGHFGRIANPQSALKRLMNLVGGSVVSSSNYSKAGIEAIMPHVVGSIDAEGPQTSHRSIIDNTDFIVFWACDPLKTNRISASIPDHGEWTWFEEMKKANKKALFIDPVKTESCKVLGGEWLPVRPQSDTALALALAHTLLTEKLHDVKFLAEYTTGFEPFADYLLGKPDGVAKSADWAAPMTEIPADTIRDLARRLVKGRTMLVSGWSPQRQHHGEQFPWAFVTLAAMVGQIGLPGGGHSQLYHLYNGGTEVADAPSLGGSLQIGKRKEIKPWPKEKGTTIIPCARVVDMLMNPGKEYDHQGKKFVYPDVRMTYWVGGNPFAHHQDRNRMIAAWRKFETFVVQDFQWTASARFADIVLPAAHWCERNDIETFGLHARKAIMGMKKMVEPMAEARDDYDIFVELATRLGVEPEFSEGKTTGDRVREVYDAAFEQAKAKKIEMPDFATFWNGSCVVEFPVKDKAAKRAKYAQFREDPLLNPLPTPSGRIEIYSKTIEKFGYDDCPPHPTWLEPLEWLGQKDKTHPMHLASNHPISRMHSQFNGTRLRESYAIAGREPCWISAQDAAARGIKTGDVVRVFNGRGQCLAGALVTEDIRPGVIQLQEGAWYDPVEPGKPGTLCRYGDPNVLTPDIPTSKLGQATAAATCMVQVERWAGETPKVKVFDTPQNA